MFKKVLLALAFFIISNAHAQKEPRFTSYNSGKAFSAITVNSKTKTVWAGTDQEGVFSLNTKDTLATDFTVFNSNDLSELKIKDMASDGYGNVWIAHQGINFQGTKGGLECISSNLTVKHYSHDRNALGFQSYYQRDGLGGMRLNSVTVDKNNTVWTVNRNHHLTSGSTFILTPGAFSFKKFDEPKFTTIGAWYNNEGKKAIQPKELPYPAYTYNPKADETPQNRNMQAISADDENIWLGCWGYVPKFFPSVSIPNRLLKLDLEGKVLGFFKFEEMGFTPGGVINNVCANGSKGTWVTTSISGKGFSVYKNDKWNYISSDSNNPENPFNKIIPENTKFNNNAIWKDKIGRVFLGTDKGLIVYNGHGDVTLAESYRIYTNYDFDSEFNIYDKDMLSSNINAGEADPKNPSKIWIATDKGIMKLFLPPTGMQVYHVRNHKTYDVTTVDNKANIGLVTVLNNVLKKGIPNDNQIPKIAADGVGSTLFRFKTDDPKGHYNETESAYTLYIGPGPAEDVKKKKYTNRYGEFKLKTLESYGPDITSADDLDYVEYIYVHPKYIHEDDYIENMPYAKFNFHVHYNEVSQTLFKHPVKIAVPPILLGHGVWSNTESMDKLDDFFQENGFDNSSIIKAWRSDGTKAENTFEEDAGIIPKYIDKLKKQAAANMFSAGKVNTIVHSRGGLYTRAYIEEISDGYPYNDDVNSLITLNTPHSGSQAANLVMDKRLIKLSYLSGSSHFIPKPINNLNPLTYVFKDVPLGELISIFGFPPKDDRELNNGAKNLLVISDYLSGVSGKDNPNFIERLNYKFNLEKLKEVPVHAVATTFKACDIGQIYCNDITEGIGEVIDPDKIPEEFRLRLPKAFFRSVFIYNAFEFLTNGVPKTIDGFSSYLYRPSLDAEGPSDFIVPLSSMEAGLDKKYISNFPGENIMHINITSNAIAPNMAGVASSPLVHNKLLNLVKENVNSKSSSFTKNSLNPPHLPYLFLAGWFGDVTNNIKTEEEVTSKIFINKDPEVFNNSIAEGSKLDFNIYTENLDKIMVSYENMNSKDSVVYAIRKPIKFENRFIYTVPKGHNGRTIIKANGYKNGKLHSVDSIHFNTKLPDSITLQKINFEQKNPIILEKENYSFNIVGTFSDGLDRIINDYEGLTFSVQDTLIISQIDNHSVIGNSEGTTFLKASVNDLEASVFITVEENTALLKTIITSFYGKLNNDKTLIELAWSTLREYENDTFILERSSNNIDFIEVNNQPGNGTTMIPMDFNYDDTSLSNHPVLYYRLKMISESGKESYSSTIKINREILSIKTDASIDSSLKLYPNPSNSEDVTLYLNSKFKDQNATLELYTLQGKHLSLQNLNVEKGENSFNLKISEHLNNGIYLVKVSTSEFVKSIKLVVKK